MNFLHWVFGVLSSGFSSSFSRFSCLFSKKIAPKCGENRLISGQRKTRKILSCLWLSWLFFPGGEKCAESCHISGQGFFPSCFFYLCSHLLPFDCQFFVVASLAASSVAILLSPPFFSPFCLSICLLFFHLFKVGFKQTGIYHPVS